VFGDDFVESLRERRPADRNNGVGGNLTHQRGSFAKKEDLDLVAGVVESEGMQENESGSCGIIGAPGTLHHDFEILFGFIGLGAEREKGQAEDLSQELTTRHNFLQEKSVPGKVGVTVPCFAWRFKIGGGDSTMTRLKFT
jgi:hypothetical protein